MKKTTTRRKAIFLVIFCAIMHSVTICYAEKNNFIEQQQESLQIRGKIIDETYEPLIGVNVIVKGRSSGTVTDMDGNYTLERIPKDAILVFSYIGMKTEEVPVNGRTAIDLVMKMDGVMLDEVVALGYGSMKKGEITSAITSVKSDEFVQGMVKDAAQLLQGKVAGLQMANYSGDPASGVDINIRGVSTISASSDPLIIIDGIPGGNINTIAPEDVETIDVLKDGSAAAIYGTRGTNGVILITTKKATAGDPSLEYHAYFSYETLHKKVNLLNASDYHTLKLDPMFKDKIADEGTSTDWIDEITQTPVNYVQNLSLKGGTSKTNYILSATYKSREGILLRTGKESLTLKAGINHNMWDNKLKLQVNINNTTATDQVTWYDAYLQASLSNPTRPVYNADGSYTEYGVSYKPYNPVALLKEETDIKKWNMLLTSGKVTFSPVYGLNLSVLGAMQRYDDMRDKWNTFNYFTTTIENKNGEVSKWGDLNTDNTLELTADYTKSIDNHHFTLLGGYSFQEFNRQGSYMYAFDFPTDYFEAWNIQSSNTISDGRATMSSYRNASRLISFFGRVTYNYNDKYMILASLRNEGSSKFGKNNKWGLFPAVSAGWRIKSEEFMQDVDFISDLKLRVGYGVTGTEIASSYQSLVLLDFTSPSYLNNEWIKGVVPASNPNPNLKWETKEEWNIGLDFGLLKNRLSGTIDLYNRTTHDLLTDYPVPVPPNYTNTMWANVGKIGNKGIEIALEGKIIDGKDFSWNLGGNFSYNVNKVISLSNDQYEKDYWYTGWTSSGIQQNTHIVKQGQPIGDFYGLKAVGLTDDGHWLVESADGTQKLQSEAGQEDKQVLGNGLPKMYAGINTTFSYKQLDLGIALRGAFDYQVFNEYRAHWETMGRISEGNLPRSVYDKPFGSNSYVWEPQVYNSYFIENGDYIKIDNVTLGYNLRFTNKYIKKLRIYVAGHNLATMTSYKGLDPEVSIKGLDPGVERKSLYPTVRSFTMGVVVNL